MRNGHWWIYITSSLVYWSEWISGETQTVKSGTCESVVDVPAPDGANIVVCLPGENVRTFQVDLPRKNRQKFLKSLPFILEDKLLHGPDDYHFFPIINGQNNGRIAVAVISKTEFDETVSRISDRNWHINLITADYMYIAAPEDRLWILDATDSPPLLRGNFPELGSALAGDITSKPHPALRLALEKSENPPKKLQVRVRDDGESEKVAGWFGNMDELGIKIEVIVDNTPRADWLARLPSPGTELNLL
ncbi:MAG: hypothetical protein HKN08_09225, partial [Gammaproteobacteria bacterium]|nr:hypothetical protein [Gammaproteobacteria bacterium]